MGALRLGDGAENGFSTTALVSATSPNLYASIAARFGETAPIPRFMRRFYEQYQDRLLYGTDMGFAAEMYRTTFRILESEDEHFYVRNLFNYHWPLHGFGLEDNSLEEGLSGQRPARLAANQDQTIGGTPGKGGCRGKGRCARTQTGLENW